jgi:hypothetical protein
MTNFDLIGVLNSYCTTNNIVFLYGANWSQNYEASQHEYYNGQQVLLADFNASPVFGNGMAISEIRYTGVLALGIKFDNDGTDNITDNEETPEVDETQYFNDGTPANLDETHYQKYTRRLLSLMSGLANIIQDIACVNELSVTNCNFRVDLNKFDENIDFVAADITIIQ